MLSTIVCNAQEMFYSEKDETLFSALNSLCTIDTIPTNNYYSFPCTDLVKDDTIDIVLRKDDNNIIEYIGCKFIPDSLNHDNNQTTQFIGRELLAFLLSDDIEETVKRNRDKNFFILLNDSIIPNDSIKNKSWFFNLWKNNNGFTINREDNNYKVTIFCPNNQNLTFIFKADVSLISGMNKKELEIKLAQQLSNYYTDDYAESTYVQDLEVLQYYQNSDSLCNDSVFTYKGDSFIIPQINDDLFYLKHDTIFTPVFDTAHIAMSFSNAILMPFLNNYYLEIKHRMYGYNKLIYTISNKDFFKFFSKDYEKFFGIETIEKDKLTGTLVFYNHEAEYIHIAYVSTTLDDLMNEGKIYMELSSFIPQHNIRTLFGKEN